ncbi:endonuclease [Arthrobacter sp. MYb227]|nr:endonuclease [Arthrobacter sp. MYb227]
MGVTPAIAQTSAPLQVSSVSGTLIQPIPYPDAPHEQAQSLKVATFNASLNRPAEGQLALDLAGPHDAQAQAVAEIVQRNAPDILLLNEFDYDSQGASARLFSENYLKVSQRGQAPANYPYTYLAPSNTGIQSGADLDGDGIVGGPGDAFGYGDFEGQFAMVLYSKYPIDAANARTFQNFLWKDMPDSQLPGEYYSELVQSVLRLPSKSVWDVPVKVGKSTVHIIASHPTPPVFDGAEKRNKRRNHDEIRLLNDYISGGEDSQYIYDDNGTHGPLESGSKFIVLGDLNSDSNTGESDPAAIKELRTNPLLVDPKPVSEKCSAFAGSRIGRSALMLDALSTADFGRGGKGVMRVDYVLPAKALPILDSGVYWPATGASGADLTEGLPPVSSDHRLVWVNLQLPK